MVDWIEEQTHGRTSSRPSGGGSIAARLDEGDYNQKKEAWWEAENALSDARLIGDLVVAAFFGAEKDKAREELRIQYRSKVEAWRANEATRHELEGNRRGVAGRREAGAADALGDRVPRGVRSGESGLRCDGGESAVS